MAAPPTRACSGRAPRWPRVADVEVAGRARGLPPATVRRVVTAVLRGERRDAACTVSFVGPRTMRRLNARFKGQDRPTDVLAFPLPHGARLLGDIYVCPAVAAREASRRGISARTELIRLVVHGTLHVLGHDHPDDDGRERSAMWRRQERYVGALA